MKRIYFAAAPAVMLLWSTATVQGATKLSQEESPSRQAQAVFQQIGALSANVSETAFYLNHSLLERPSFELRAEQLDELRAGVNAINKGVLSLEAERPSLTAWERQTLDGILPLVHEIGMRAQNAILTFKSDEPRLFATSYPADTALIRTYAEQIETMVHGQLKLARLQREQLDLQQQLEERR